MVRIGELAGEIEMGWRKFASVSSQTKGHWCSTGRTVLMVEGYGIGMKGWKEGERVVVTRMRDFNEDQGWRVPIVGFGRLEGDDSCE